MRGKAALALYLGDERGLQMFHGERWTNLYAIKAGDYVKFGLADYVEQRMDGMQIGCPLEMQIHGFLSVPERFEMLVHRRVADEYVRGEWFRWAGAAIEVADAIRAKDHERLSRFIGFSADACELICKPR